MLPIAFDVETARVTDRCIAPPITCLAFSAEDSHELLHVQDPVCAETVYEMLNVEGDGAIVGHNIAFDMACVVREWPELMPMVFEAYDKDRITDTMLREKLQHIALGIYRGYMNIRGKAIKLNYGLDDCVERRLGMKLEKGAWQLRYGELRNVPLTFWEPGAREYPVKDTHATRLLWLDQEDEGREFLEDQYRQARAAFWMQLMASWGFTTDPQGVAAFAKATQQHYDDIAQSLIRAGLLRPDGTRNIKAAQAQMVMACRNKGIEIPRSDPTITNPHGNVKLDKDSCALSGDPILEAYSDLASTMKKLSTDVPLLERGRVHVRWDLLKTGRTSTSPNIQNLPTGFVNGKWSAGQRECFVPSSGWFAAADFSAFELRTVSQICITVLGHSRLAEALNKGFDPHLEVARRILGCSYEEAEKLKKEGNSELDMARQSGKIANFGFPGGLGIARFSDYARKSYGVIISEDQARSLKQYWLEAWPEFEDYHRWIGSQVENPGSRIKCLFSNRWMGNLSFTEASNGLYQALAAEGAKRAGWLITRACYAEPDSPLYGCRPVNFPHDEFITEVPADVDRANAAAVEQARLMKIGASEFLPDVAPVVEPYLMLRWSKQAKPIKDERGRLLPWDLGWTKKSKPKFNGERFMGWLTAA